MSAKIVCGKCGAELHDSAVRTLKDRFERVRGIEAVCKCGNRYRKAPPRCSECKQFSGACRPWCSHNKNKRYAP